MTFNTSCSSGTTFSAFHQSNVLALSVVRKGFQLRQEIYGAGKQARVGLIVQMRNPDPSFEGLKTSGFDPAALFRRLDGDIQLLRDLVQIFSEECPLLLERINSAIQHGAFEDVRRLSHKLKGSALQFSGSGVANLAGSLEQMGARQTLEGAPQIFSNLEQEAARLQRSLQSMATGEGWPS